MFLRASSTRRQNERLNLDTWMLQVSLQGNLASGRPARIGAANAAEPRRWHDGTGQSPARRQGNGGTCCSVAGLSQVTEQTALSGKQPGGHSVHHLALLRGSIAQASAMPVWDMMHPGPGMPLTRGQSLIPRASTRRLLHQNMNILHQNILVLHQYEHQSGQAPAMRGGT